MTATLRRALIALIVRAGDKEKRPQLEITGGLFQVAWFASAVLLHLPSSALSGVFGLVGRGFGSIRSGAGGFLARALGRFHPSIHSSARGFGGIFGLVGGLRSAALGLVHCFLAGVLCVVGSTDDAVGGRISRIL
jgi:hypothetical protein